jgi:hypothetical protein
MEALGILQGFFPGRLDSIFSSFEHFDVLFSKSEFFIGFGGEADTVQDGFDGGAEFGKIGREHFAFGAHIQGDNYKLFAHGV